MDVKSLEPLFTLVDRGLPAALHDTKDVALRERAQLAVLAPVLVGVWVPLYAVVVGVGFSAWRSGLAIALCGSVIFAGPFAQAHWQRPGPAGHALAGGLFAVIMSFQLLNGGIDAPVAMAMGLVPVFAIPICGLVPGLLWGLVAMLGLLSLAGLSVSGVLPEPELTADQTRLLSALIMFSLPILFVTLLVFFQLLKDGAQATLAARESELRTVFDHAVDGFLVADANGVVVRVNRATERLFGQTSEQMVGQKVGGLFSGGTQLASRVGARLEAEVVRPDGEVVSVGVAIGVSDSQPPRIVAVVRDERLQREAAEAIRVARDEALQASQTKSGFLANMSHELRTPLNAIIGYSELLLDDARGGPVADDLGRIRTAGKHLLGLINDILDLSKIESGKLELHPEEVDLPGLLTEVVRLVEPLAARNQNAVTLQVSEDVGGVRTDQVRLRQVLYNLLSNASKFTESGSILLSVDAFNDAQGARVLRLAVHDTGIGLTPEQSGRIFNEFVQADGTTTRKYGGTGLGLSITRRLCQLMGGDVAVVSRPGEGSIFTATIAARLSGGRTVTPRPAERSSFRGGVLVIDDDPDARELLRRLLSGAGYRVIEASTGEQGIAIAREQRPRAIVLDIRLPGMDGWSVLAALKGDPDTSGIPVVLVTMTEDRALGLALGAVEYFKKPVDREGLLGTLRRLRGEETAGEALVVEDDAALAELVTRTLAGAGWRVRVAADGVEAISELEAGVPDVVLLDLMMPRLDGFGVLEAMRARDDWREVPVIVVTAKELDASDVDRLRGSVARILPKGGVPRADLLEEVLDVVALHATRPPAPERAGGPA